MTKYPKERAEVISFTPPSLTNLPEPPVFRLRPATFRDRERLADLMFVENIRQHSMESLRAETLRGLEANWDTAKCGEYLPRVKAFWDAADQYGAETENFIPTDEHPKPPPFEHDDMEAMIDLSTRISDAWPPLRKMAAANRKYNRMFPLLILSIVVAGWNGITTAFAREDDAIPIEVIDELETEVEELERDNAGKIEGIALPGTAFAELTTKAISMFRLSRSEEKNSASPSRSAATPNISTANGKARRGGSSKASTTKKTPAT